MTIKQIKQFFCKHCFGHVPAEDGWPEYTGRTRCSRCDILIRPGCPATEEEIAFRKRWNEFAVGPKARSVVGFIEKA